MNNSQVSLTLMKLHIYWSDFNKSFVHIIYLGATYPRSPINPPETWFCLMLEKLYHTVPYVRLKSEISIGVACYEAVGRGSRSFIWIRVSGI